MTQKTLLASKIDMYYKPLALKPLIYCNPFIASSVIKITSCHQFYRIKLTNWWYWLLNPCIRPYSYYWKDWTAWFYGHNLWRRWSISFLIIQSSRLCILLIKKALQPLIFNAGNQGSRVCEVSSSVSMKRHNIAIVEERVLSDIIWYNNKMCKKFIPGPTRLTGKSFKIKFWSYGRWWTDWNAKIQAPLM